MLKTTTSRKFRRPTTPMVAQRRVMRLEALEARTVPTVSGLEIKGITAGSPNAQPMTTSALQAGGTYYVHFNFTSDHTAAATIKVATQPTTVVTGTEYFQSGSDAIMKVVIPTASQTGPSALFVDVDDTTGAEEVKKEISIVAPEVPTVTSVTFGDGTAQRSMVKQIVVNFSREVQFEGSVESAFILRRISDNKGVTLHATPDSGPTTQVTLTFSGEMTESGGSLVDGSYQFMISAAQVSSQGLALDGNGDGLAGGEYVVNGNKTNGFYRLFGDCNGSGSVDQCDYLALRKTLARPSTIFDYNADGNVDQIDFLAFRERIGSEM